MADEKKAPETPMVRGFDRLGNKVQVPKDEVGRFYALGGRVAKKEEVEAGLKEQAAAEAEARLKQQFDVQTTTQKVGGVLLQGPAALSPQLMAGKRGAEAGFTAGLAAPLEAKAAEAIVPGAGKAMARRELDLKEAHEGAYGAGEAAGMVGAALASGGGGAAGAAAKAIPGVGISAIGGAIERGVAGRLAGLAAKGVAGRAAATAAEIGARGAFEGGAYAATQAASEQVLADPDLSAQKLFTADGLTAVGKAGLIGTLTGGVGGAALGGAGSLAASGARKAFGGLARVMSKGEPVASELAAKEVGAAERTAMLPAEPTGGVLGRPPVAGEPVLGTLEREVAAATQAGEAEALQAANRNPTKDWLMKQSHGLAFDALNATKKQGLDAIEHVKGGREAVGEYVQREIISKNPSLLKAGLNGRADDLYQAIQADKYGRVRQGLSEAIKAHPARVNVEELANLGQQMHADMLKDPTRVAGADPFLGRIMQEAGAIGRSGQVAADGTMDAAESYYLRAALEKRAHEVGQQSGAAKDAYKQFLRKWDDVTVRALDEAAEKAGKGGGRDEILKWKREYQLASAAEEAAKHGTDRVIGNNAIGLREGIGAAVAIASGHILAGPAAAVAMKVAKERGKAMGAFALAKLAERDALAAWVQKVDKQITKASTGLLELPAKGVPKDPMPPTRALSRTALAKVAEFTADPETYLDKVTRQHESLAGHSPEIAESLTAKHIQAMTFLASKVPVSPDPDPLDPHPAPKLTKGEEAELGRYWYYVEKPSRFYAEVARGKLTYEGAEVAQALTPGPFEQLQMQTADALTERLAKGDRLPFRQRQVLGVLLDFAATPSQRPEHARFLQKNAITPEPPPPPAPRRAAPNPSQRTSSYDRLEADGPGRR